MQRLQFEWWPTRDRVHGLCKRFYKNHCYNAHTARQDCGRRHKIKMKKKNAEAKSKSKNTRKIIAIIWPRMKQEPKMDKAKLCMLLSHSNTLSFRLVWVFGARALANHILCHWICFGFGFGKILLFFVLLSLHSNTINQFIVLFQKAKCPAYCYCPMLMLDDALRLLFRLASSLLHTPRTPRTFTLVKTKPIYNICNGNIDR